MVLFSWERYTDVTRQTIPRFTTRSQVCKLRGRSEGEGGEEGGEGGARGQPVVAFGPATVEVNSFCSIL